MDTILEIATGLGVGGAERILQYRLEVPHTDFNVVCVNTNPKLQSVVVKADKLVLVKKWQLPNLYFICKELDPVVVIVRAPRDLIRLSLVRLFLRRSFYLVFEAHSTCASPRLLFNRLISKIVLLASLNVDLIISVSKAVQAGDQVHNSKKSIVKYMGSLIDFDQKPTEVTSGKRLIFIGRMTGFKRPIWLLHRIYQVRKTFRDSNSRLVLVGGGRLLKRVEKKIVNLALGDIVTLVGQVNDPTPFLMNSDWLISCSRNEGLPLAFYEAKLAGLSILTTPSGGGSEILTQDDILLDTFKAHEFEKALVRILTEPRYQTVTKILNNARYNAHALAIDYYKELLGTLKNLPK